MFLGCADIVWKTKRFDDHRENAITIIESSNACPYRWRSGAFLCAYCNTTFGDFSGMREHSRGHIKNRDKLLALKNFANIKIEISDLRCDICKTKIENVESLKDHLISVHEIPLDLNIGLGVIPYIINGNIYKCALCKVQFEVFSKLNCHMNEHFPAHICYWCGKGFTAIDRLKAHFATHNEAPDSDTVPVYIKCTKCDESFSSRYERDKHYKKLHSGRQHRCPYCLEGFTSYRIRLRHLRLEHGVKQDYPCSLCPAVFSMFNLRTKHISQVHVREFKFFCEVCRAGFVTSAQLRMHAVKHSSDKPFRCEHCSKAFARAKTLKEHVKIHLNDRRFVCEYCKSAFVQKCTLKYHIKSRHIAMR